jgi:hypothetical protein
MLRRYGIPAILISLFVLCTSQVRAAATVFTTHFQQETVQPVGELLCLPLSTTYIARIPIEGVQHYTILDNGIFRLTEHWHGTVELVAEDPNSTAPTYEGRLAQGFYETTGLPATFHSTNNITLKGSDESHTTIHITIQQTVTAVGLNEVVVVVGCPQA